MYCLSVAYMSLRFVYINTAFIDNERLCSVTVITTDFESVNPGSIPGTTYNAFHLNFFVHYSFGWTCGWTCR